MKRKVKKRRGFRREELRPFEGQEVLLVARFDVLSTCYRHGRMIETILLQDVHHADTGQYLADHVWISDFLPFSCILRRQEYIIFRGEVYAYLRGYGIRRVRGIQQASQCEVVRCLEMS